MKSNKLMQAGSRRLPPLRDIAHAQNLQIPFSGPGIRDYVCSSRTAVGRLLQEARLKQKLSISELARRLGVSVQSMNNIEKGHQKCPYKYVNLLLSLLHLRPTAIHDAFKEDLEKTLSRKLL